MNKAPINVQDSFFYNLRKDNVPVTVRLTSGEERLGRLRRFDKFALVLEVEGREEMIYKHAIASVVSMAPLSSVHAAPAAAAAVRPPGA
jgi:host factor-I protein